ncbi:BMP family ABC transporter substrate-binding protein [Clostridium aestuarii]|uniref:BMP family ABC transporter substrate-binding protein n=1 Tax=Clostridium aestuarii TaxID=338193 RepID=A0ABT4CVW4_9CLOT|nr:BMP family ABC transporter substrate-binding protein [Clostridium aestuarii]MCY6483152.1 BMP family ABC transporter substrate-binding protein [Clostridium aestuarii]
MKKRRLVAILASVAVVASLFAGCGDAAKKAEEKPTSDIKIGLSTDEGGLNDKSFNQAADEGIKKAKEEFNFEYKPVESTQKEDFIPHLQTLALTENCNLTFAIGYQMQEALKEVATSEEAKDKHFAIVDAVVDAPNVQSLVFKENEGSFLVGVIAAKTTKTNKIGFIGGKEGPIIGKFEAGFIAGARAVNSDIKVDVRYADSFGDSNKGYELAKLQYGSGCDVVFHAAGGVGLGLFKAAKEIKDAGNQVWAIGVDQDQVLTVTDEEKKPMYADVILTSMIKRVDTATYEAAKAVAEGKFEGGKTIVFGLKEDGVGIAPTSRGEISEDLKDIVKQNVPNELVELADKYAEAIKAGKIQVPEKPEEAKTFTAEPLQ